MSKPAAVALIVATVITFVAAGVPAGALGGSGRPALVLAAGQAAPLKPMDTLTPEERMQRRWPQPVKVGDLIGLRVLDDQDCTLGYVQSVVRTAEGKLRLIVPYGGFLGWGRRPIAVPIEVVAIAGRQLAALDMTRAEFEAAPAWNDPASRPLPPGDIVRVGLYRR
jgi:hypothetical protein